MRANLIDGYDLKIASSSRPWDVVVGGKRYRTSAATLLATGAAWDERLGEEPRRLLDVRVGGFRLSPRRPRRLALLCRLVSATAEPHAGAGYPDKLHDLGNVDAGQIADGNATL